MSMAIGGHLSVLTLVQSHIRHNPAFNTVFELHSPHAGVCLIFVTLAMKLPDDTSRCRGGLGSLLESGPERSAAYLAVSSQVADSIIQSTSITLYRQQLQPAWNPIA